MAEQFDAYYEWLGIPPTDRPPSHYSLLGIQAFEGNQVVISNAADRQMRHIRSFGLGKRVAIAQELLNELSAARVCLLDPVLDDPAEALTL